MILENLNIVKAHVRESCEVSRRDPGSVRIISVTKTQPAETIREVYSCGMRDVGENKAQELRDKSTELQLPGINWHFIGHLQSNKVKYVVPVAEFIHSVDSLKIATDIDSFANKIGKIQNILLEVNLADEASKFGLRDFDSVQKLAESVNLLPNIKLCGLMTMAPYTTDEYILRKCFADLRHFSDSLNNSGFGLKELSMGMTNDYRIAIEEGATMIRIGTAIFGERNYNY